MARINVIRRLCPKLVAGLLAAHGCIVGVSTVSAAEFEAAPPREVVRIGDLNLHDSRGIAAAYGRLLWAAQRVCTGADSADYWVRESATPCLMQAVSQAVVRIGAPQLIAYALAQPLLQPK